MRPARISDNQIVFADHDFVAPDGTAYPIGQPDYPVRIVSGELDWNHGKPGEDQSYTVLGELLSPTQIDSANSFRDCTC